MINALKNYHFYRDMVRYTTDRPQGPYGRAENVYHYPKTGIWTKEFKFDAYESEYEYFADIKRETTALDYYGMMQCHTPQHNDILHPMPSMQGASPSYHRILITEHVAGQTIGALLDDGTVDQDVRQQTAMQYVIDRLPVTTILANIDDNSGNIIVRHNPIMLTGYNARLDRFTNIDTDLTMQYRSIHMADNKQFPLTGNEEDELIWQDNNATDQHVIYMLNKHLILVKQDDYWNNVPKFERQEARDLFAHYEYALSAGQMTRGHILQSLHQKMNTLEHNKASIDPDDYKIMRRRGFTACEYLQTADIPTLRK